MSLLPANIGLIMEEDASSLDDLFGSLDSFSEVNADGSLLMAVNYPSDGMQNKHFLEVFYWSKSIF